MTPNARDAALRLVEESRDELVQLTRDLVRFPTINPPGEAYEPCAHFLGERLAREGFAVEYVEAEGRAEPTGEALAPEGRASLAILASRQLERVGVALLNQGEAEEVRLHRTAGLAEEHLRSRVNALRDRLNQSPSRFLVNVLSVHPSSSSAARSRRSLPQRS